jgi:hypothetical protein
MNGRARPAANGIFRTLPGDSTILAHQGRQMGRIGGRSLPGFSNAPSARPDDVFFFHLKGSIEYKKSVIFKIRSLKKRA